MRKFLIKLLSSAIGFLESRGGRRDPDPELDCEYFIPEGCEHPSRYQKSCMGDGHYVCKICVCFDLEGFEELFGRES